jgi:hypothetical protein
MQPELPTPVSCLIKKSLLNPRVAVTKQHRAKAYLKISITISICIN